MIGSLQRHASMLFALTAWLAGVASIATVAAQPLQSASGPELRPLYATAADIADGKRLADGACARCHGAGGVSAADGVPHLAGQRPAYLYLELRAYQTGARGNTPMTDAAKFLAEDALVKVAAYYASLEPAPPAAAAAAKSAPAKADPVQAGKAAAAACAGCHGDAGVSKTPGMPSLAGFDPQYLTGAMKAYKSGQRKHDLMKGLMSAVSDADIANIALFYALQKPAPAVQTKSGDAAAGKSAAAACAGCHGEKGTSATPKTTPSLAGQDAQYLAAAMIAYKDGSRSDDTMKGVSAAIDETGARNLAAFYASQTPQAASVRKPLALSEWVQRCDRCHGTNGNSTDPRLPALAAQRLDYLVKTLNAYRTGQRTSPQMAAMSDVLTESDVEGLAAYYARQKARGAVYVMIPAK
jgi:cytochrome c553